MVVKMTLKQNIVVRMVGLFMVFAPNAGAKFLLDVYAGVHQRLQSEALGDS